MSFPVAAGVTAHLRALMEDVEYPLTKQSPFKVSFRNGPNVQGCAASLSPHGSSLEVYSPFERAFIGLVLVAAGGLAYAMLAPVLVPISALLLIAGVMIFLQSSRAFRVINDARFIMLLGIACGLVIVVDWWPVQIAFARMASGSLLMLGIPPLVFLNPQLGGLQVLLFVPAAGTEGLVGGEIDNACAGLPVLVPTLLLLWSAKPEMFPLPDRPRLTLFAASLVGLGDLVRIVVELWIPAVGLAPFELVHYPGAFLLGLAGLFAIALAGERWSLTPKP